MRLKSGQQKGRKSVSIADCLRVTTKGSDFYVHCENDLSGAINLDSYNKILKEKPKIVDGKALEQAKDKIDVKGSVW